MKRGLLFSLAFLIAALGLAAPRPLYRIQLRDGTRVLSQDRPVQRGSVLLYRAYPGGSWAGLPQEDVVTVMPARFVAGALIDETSVVAPQPGRMLEPGEVIFLGPMAGDQAPPTSSYSPTAAAAPQLPGGVYDPRNPMFGSYGSPGGGGAPAPGTPGDLARAVSAAPPTAQTTIGPDGFPLTTASPAPVIGPDGQPVMAPARAAGSTPPTMGPNGTPVLAPPGTPGSSQPVIGPNGTPVLAPPGAPGSSPAPVGPNGFPAAPAPGSKGPGR